MPRHLICLALGLGLVGCASPAPPQAPLAAPAPLGYALQDTGATVSATSDADDALFDDPEACGQVFGSGDSHPGDGRFYEITVDARRSGHAVSGTLVLYTMKDVLAAPTLALEPRVYRGRITKLAIKGERARARGVLDTGEAFSFSVNDRVSDAITESAPYDDFSFDTAGLHAEDAFIHEGDLEVTPDACLPAGL